MNTHEENNEERNDDLDRLLAPLREAAPTEGMRRANRRAALDATRVTPWWKRSISIPVPVALATAATLLIAVGWRSLHGADSPDFSPMLIRQQPAPAEPDPETLSPNLVYARTETHGYAPGVGITRRHVVYKPLEDQ